MASSEARILANRANSAKSSGPTSTEGKQRSRRNGLKHGLTGQGVVVPEGDADEVERRVEALEADLDPQSPLGQILVRQMATLSVRMERGAKQESAALATRVRHAADEFEEARLAEVERLFGGIADDPRDRLRRLRKSPEGVDRLILAWRDLRDDLTRGPRSVWTISHLEMAANLIGMKGADARDSRIEALWKGSWGNFGSLADHEGGGLDAAARKGWARDRLVERIDAEVAELEAHRESLDHEAIELDRLEAGDRALFDPSRDAALARRYEGEARRGFFKALKEFRQAEAEVAERAESAPAQAPSPAPNVAASEPPLASSWEGPLSMARDLDSITLEPPMPRDRALRDAANVPLTIGRAALTAG